MSNNLNILFNQNAQNVWNPAIFKENPILFVDDNNKQIFLLTQGNVQTLDYSQWSQSLPRLQSTFDLTHFNNKAALIISLDRTRSLSSLKLTSLILHESFHSYIQVTAQGWKKNNFKQIRGDIYPLQSIPRYFRMEMYSSLRDYLQNGEKIEDLQRYSYWFLKWKTNFPEEYDNYTDRVEGSAEYFSNQQITFLKNQRSATKITAFVNHQQSKTFAEIKTDFSLTRESYHLGVLSGIILDKKFKQWKNEVAKGASPLELLALLQTKKRQKTNNELQREMLNISIKKMQLIDSGGQLDQAISRLANPKTILLIIPMTHVETTSFTSSGMYQSFFNFKVISEVQFVKLLTPLKLTHKDWQAEIPSNEIWIMARKHPCLQKAPATVLALDSKDFEFTKGNLKIHSPFSFEIKAKGLNDRRVFCAQL